MPRETAAHSRETGKRGRAICKARIAFANVFLDKDKKNNRLQDAESSTCRVFNTHDFIERICQRLQDAVDHDPQERKDQLVFLVEFFHVVSSVSFIS